MQKLHPSITPARVARAVRAEMFGLDNPGFCCTCGHKQDGCEPDARNYECEHCGAHDVFGAAELLVGLVP